MVVEADATAGLRRGRSSCPGGSGQGDGKHRPYPPATRGGAMLAITASPDIFLLPAKTLPL